jgi:flagellar hook-length control protein FliK
MTISLLPTSTSPTTARVNTSRDAGIAPASDVSISQPVKKMLQSVENKIDSRGVTHKDSHQAAKQTSSKLTGSDNSQGAAQKISYEETVKNIVATTWDSVNPATNSIDMPLASSPPPISAQDAESIIQQLLALHGQQLPPEELPQAEGEQAWFQQQEHSSNDEKIDASLIATGKAEPRLTIAALNNSVTSHKMTASSKAISEDSEAVINQSREKSLLNNMPQLPDTVEKKAYGQQIPLTQAAFAQSINAQLALLVTPAEQAIPSLQSMENNQLSVKHLMSAQDFLVSTPKVQIDQARWGESMLSTLRQQITTQIQSQQQQTTIRLDPPELGVLEIFLQHENGRINIQINANQSDVARMLQQTSDKLRNELVQQAFVEVNVDIQQGQSGSGKHNQFLLKDDNVIRNHTDSELLLSASNTNTQNFLAKA